MNFASAQNALNAAFRVARQEWQTSYALSYLTRTASLVQHEYQTRAAGYGTTPATTSKASPYLPSQRDMAANDWRLAYPDTLTLGVATGGAGLFHEAMQTLYAGTPAVARSAWATTSALPYVTRVTRQQIEIQTITRTATARSTSVPAPYSPSQDDMAASDWEIVNPEAF